MTKKTISKFFVIGLGIFVMSGCSVYPFSTPNLPRIETPVPVQQATTTEATSVATSTVGEVSKIDTSGWTVFSDPVLNYTLKYPKGFFWWDPKVEVFDCDADKFNQDCPYIHVSGISDMPGAIKSGFVKLERKTIAGQQFCLQSWSEGAAGTSYVNYYYINFSQGKCATLELTKAYPNCDNYNPGPDQDKCKNDNNVVAPATLDAILASFDFNLASASSTADSGKVLRELQTGKDYQINYPAGYFVEGPKVFEISCDMSKGCPCVYNGPGTIYGNQQDKETFCQEVPPKSVNGFCVQQWDGVAAGTTYSTYFYTKAIPGSADRCAMIQFTKQLTTDCGVYGGEGAAQATAQCEKEKTDAPGIINNVISSFKLISSQPVQE
jgi:hypothetical protein